MAVHGTDVAEPQLLEQHSTQQTGLYRILHLRKETFHRIAEDGHLVQDVQHLDLQTRVEGGQTQSVERVGNAAHARTDRHLVVVEHHGHVRLQPAGVVHGLEDYARGKSSVANYGNRVAIIFRRDEFIAALQSQRGGNAASGVTGHQQIVRAFGRVGVAHQATLVANRVETGVAAGEHLVGINLVARVPDKPILAEIKRRVQSQRQLDHAQVRGQVGRSRLANAAQSLAHLAGQLVKLFIRETVKVAGRSDCSKQFVHQ